MIIIQIINGPGNQMFQYATERILAKVKNTKLKFNILLIRTYALHCFVLNHFFIKEKYINKKEILNINIKGILNSVKKK